MWSGIPFVRSWTAADDVPRRRQLAAQDQRGRDAGLLERERPEPDLLGDGAG